MALRATHPELDEKTLIMMVKIKTFQYIWTHIIIAIIIIIIIIIMSIVVI